MLHNIDKVRLNKSQIDALINSIKGICDEAYIFGSRADLSKKGGDIDLLVFAKNNAYDLSKTIRRNYFKEFEEKIDVVVFDNSNLTELQSAFLNTIKKVKIYEQ
jgi:predicted nucleotidyltransferase